MVKSIKLLELLTACMESIDKSPDVRMKMTGKCVEIDELLHTFEFTNIN